MDVFLNQTYSFFTVVVAVDTSVFGIVVAVAVAVAVAVVAEGAMAMKGVPAAEVVAAVVVTEL